MGFLRRLFGKMQHYSVYCQGCDLDITALGGYVSPDGKVYCGTKKSDGTVCIAGGLPKGVDAPELQRAIHWGHLTKYSSLEERTKMQKALSPAVRKFSSSDVRR